MTAVLDNLGIDWAGKSRQACPSCAKSSCTALHVSILADGAVAYCHRCHSSWFERERESVGPMATLHDIRQRREHEIRRAAEAGRLEREQQSDAAKDARAIWDAARPVTSHVYLSRKKIAAHGVRIDAEGRLVVPMYVGNEIVNVQRIFADGAKRFLRGGRTRGAYYVLRDCSLDIGAVFVAEGFATGATVHEAMGLPVVVAFSASNLLAVAATARRLFPGDAIVVAADNDANGTNRNVGLEAAERAAREIGGLLVAPDMAGDWNDLYIAKGWAEVVSQLNRAADHAIRSRS